MIYNFFLLLAFLITTACTLGRLNTYPAFAQSIQDKEITHIATKLQKEGDIPALGILIVKEGRTIHFSTEGVRSMQSKVPANISDKWHLGSDTKSMTAFLVALAIQESKFNYDTSIHQVLEPDNKIHQHNKNLKISDLLVHQSGLRDIGEIDDGKTWNILASSKYTLIQQRQKITQASLREKPRKMISGKADRNFNYANINYIILGSILENVYGKSWEDIISEKIFKPLGMNSCGFGVAGLFEEIEPSQPWPHYIQDNILVGIPPKFKADNPPAIGPAGSVHCNLEDWSKFVYELVNVYQNKGQLLKQVQLAEKYFKNSNGFYTFGGWGKSGDYSNTIFQHAGSNTFNYAIATFSPKENTVLLLTMNTAQPKSQKSFMELHGKLLKRFLVP